MQDFVHQTYFPLLRFTFWVKVLENGVQLLGLHITGSGALAFRSFGLCWSFWSSLCLPGLGR